MAKGKLIDAEINFFAAFFSREVRLLINFSLCLLSLILISNQSSRLNEIRLKEKRKRQRREKLMKASWMKEGAASASAAVIKKLRKEWRLNEWLKTWNEAGNQKWNELILELGGIHSTSNPNWNLIQFNETNSERCRVQNYRLLSLFKPN